MTIGKKISLACLGLVALTVTLGTVSIINIGGMNRNVEELTKESLPELGNLSIMIETAYKSTYFAILSVSSEDLAVKVRDEAVVAKELDRFDAAAKAYQETDTSARGREIMTEILTAHALMFKGWENVKPLSRAMKNKEAYAAWMEQLSAHVEERAAGIEKLIAYNAGNASGLGTAAVEKGASARLWTVLILVFSIVSGGLLAFFIVRGINNSLTTAAVALAEGADQVASSSGQISGSSQALAQGASEQAASLEETSASSEEMSSMTRKNAENAQEAAALMNSVSNRVNDANRTLAAMMTSMQEIGASSGKISKIIKVIDEIAFQTNILALNAAVEAARAGEAGMGFAVVADEVRNLAQRCAEAARETASLIEDSILKSGEGSSTLKEVAASIQAITEGTEKVKVHIDTVDASSKEQAEGVAQIAKAMAQMDQVTQATAASAEESAAASEELNAQSQILITIVGQLQALVGASAGVSRRSTAARPTLVRGTSFAD